MKRLLPLEFMLRITVIAGVIPCACMPSEQAAPKPSPNIAGSWVGTAKGTEYFFKNVNGTVLSLDEKFAGTVTSTITQTGNDLTFTVTITSTPPKSSGQAPETFTVPFTGKVGDFAFWATGMKPAGVNPAENVFSSGHFDTKPSKITGNMIFYRTDVVINLTYALKKSPSSIMVRDEPLASAFSSNAEPRDARTTFNITGSSTGKAYTFSTSNKPVPVKSTFTGTVDTTTGTVMVTVVTGSNSEMFTETETFGGKGFVDAGASGSDNRLLFGLESKTGSSGIGWGYNDSGMSEFKFKVKKE